MYCRFFIITTFHKQIMLIFFDNCHWSVCDINLMKWHSTLSGTSGNSYEMSNNVPFSCHVWYISINSHSNLTLKLMTPIISQLLTMKMTIFRIIAHLFNPCMEVDWIWPNHSRCLSFVHHSFGFHSDFISNKGIMRTWVVNWETFIYCFFYLIWFDSLDPVALIVVILRMK